MFVDNAIGNHGATEDSHSSSTTRPLLGDRRAPCLVRVNTSVRV